MDATDKRTEEATERKDRDIAQKPPQPGLAGETPANPQPVTPPDPSASATGLGHDGQPHPRAA